MGKPKTYQSCEASSFSSVLTRDNSMASHLCVVAIAALLCGAAQGHDDDGDDFHECGKHKRSHYVVGSCMMSDCNKDHGHHRTHCHEGDCICKKGNCPGEDNYK